MWKGRIPGYGSGSSADWRDPWAGRWVRVAIQWWETNGRMQGKTFLAWDMTL